MIAATRLDPYDSSNFDIRGGANTPPWLNESVIVEGEVYRPGIQVNADGRGISRAYVPCQ